MNFLRKIPGTTYYACRKGNIYNQKRKQLIPFFDSHGYLQVSIYKEGKKKNSLVHRLVAKTFIENPKGLPQINHKDLNKENNAMDNLEWCDARYNIQHYHLTRMRIKGQLFFFS